MKINSIRFVRPILRRRFVLVELSTGNTYTITREGRFAVVLPPCNDSEKPTLNAVYHAIWPWLEKAEGRDFDRQTKRAVAQVADRFNWPACFSGDGLDKYNCIADHIRQGQDINR